MPVATYYILAKNVRHYSKVCRKIQDGDFLWTTYLWEDIAAAIPIFCGGSMPTRIGIGFESGAVRT